jgi:division protein CdvB (Snf7/Vps24/ESCRT-III family)
VSTLEKEEVIRKLKIWERELFEKTVQLVLQNEIERAIIYANECAFVRTLIRSLKKSKIPLSFLFETCVFFY